MIHQAKPNRAAATDLQGVPSLGPRITRALQVRQDLTPEEEAIADAEIAAAMKAIRDRHIAGGKRSYQPVEEDFDDEA